MRLVVFGGRDLELSVFALDHWLTLFGYLPGEFEMVEGEARGADMSARRWAEHHGMTPKKFPANWIRYKKAAGPVRNREMAEYADEGVGFITDGSIGTKNMMETMGKLGKPTRMVRYEIIPCDQQIPWEDL